MELAPVGPPGSAAVTQGDRPVTTGDPEFDLRIRRPGQRRRDGPRLLVPADPLDGRRACSRSVHPGGMLVSINPERMLVQIDRNLGTNAESLAWVVQQALTLHDGLIEGVTRRMGQGVAIVDDRMRGKKIRARPRARSAASRSTKARSSSAPSCNTPHHRDCWEYVGACSIYGCNGKVGVRE